MFFKKQKYEHLRFIQDLNFEMAIAIEILLHKKQGPVYLTSMLMPWQFMTFPDSKVHGVDMGPFWGRQDPCGPHVGPMNFAIWVATLSRRTSAAMLLTYFFRIFPPWAALYIHLFFSDN